MKIRASIVAASLLAFGGVIIAIAQEKKAQLSQEEMMAVYAKYAQPGQFHKNLDPLVGSWECTSKMWMEPGAQPEESKAASEAKWVLGGRFVEEEVSGDMGGMPFHGMGFTGYDNLKNEYNLIWLDEMSTSVMYTAGKGDSTGKVITMYGTYTDPLSNLQEKKFRTVTRILSNDQHVYEMYDQGPDGKEFKNLEITYIRKK